MFNMISENDIKRDEEKRKNRTSIIIKNNPLDSELRRVATEKTQRRGLILGRSVHKLPNGSWSLGKIVYHIPSPFPSQTEAIYLKGPPGSGKSWTAYSLAGQSFFAENRTWVIIDTKFSVTYDTKIIVKKDGKCQSLKIGSFIDKLLPTHYTSQERDISHLRYFVMSLQNNHKVSWKLVTHVSKHISPERIIKIVTESGKKIEATEGHSFIILKNGKYRPIKGSELKEGYWIPVYKKNKRENDILIDVSHILKPIYDENETYLHSIIKNDWVTIKDAKKILKLKKIEPLEKMVNGDIVWERIISIEILHPLSDFVYDITVKGTHNFMLSNMCFVHNSYIGNNRPNVLFRKELRNMGLKPMGIPRSQIDVIAPMYYVAGLTPKEIYNSLVTDYYRVPLRLCTLPVMFELTKLNKQAGYASSFDQRFKELMIKTNNNPKLSDVYDMINSIIEDPEMKRMKWVYQMMKKKIEEIEKFTIDDKNQWSSLGQCLERAAREGRSRWIVFTLAHAQNPADDLNLAIISTVLKEIKLFSEKVRHNQDKYPNFSLGVMMDELHTYVREKDASTRLAIHDLLFAWGRTSRILRIFLTQKDEQLDKVFRDDIKKEISPVGTYQCIISCAAIPEPGYITYVNRVCPSPYDPEKPLYYPKVKACPPLFEVESDDTDDEKWKRKVMEIIKKDFVDNDDEN